MSASVLLLLLRHLHGLHRDAFAHCPEALACARRLRDRGIFLRLQHWSVRIVEAGHHQKPAYHQDQQCCSRQFSRVLPQRSSASQSAQGWARGDHLAHVCANRADGDPDGRQEEETPDRQRVQDEGFLHAWHDQLGECRGILLRIPREELVELQPNRVSVRRPGAQAGGSP